MFFKSKFFLGATALALGLAIYGGSTEAEPLVDPVLASFVNTDRRLMSQEHAMSVAERAFLARVALEEVPFGDRPSIQVMNYLNHVSQQVKLSKDLYDISLVARTKAVAAKVLANNHSESMRWVEEVDRDLSFLDDWLKLYGEKITVHRRSEPAWICGQPETVAQAILAWVTLESVNPSAMRREKIRKFGEGLCALLMPETYQYPFGAHMSRMTVNGKVRNYSLPNSATGEMVAGASLIIEKQFCSAALARAGKLLGNKDFIQSADVEGLGLMAHLAMMNVIPYDYAPRPETEVESPLATATVLENLATLYEITGKPIYGELAGCAAINVNDYDKGAIPRAVKSWSYQQLGRMGLEKWIGAIDYKSAFVGQVIELENGKAVEKSFDVHEFNYPAGTLGKLAVVGRDNMFWMRFDVDREDSYYFHLSFLKGDASGGLVSVMMRIDGDNIFNVNLDGATEDPFVDVNLVAGPRHLRKGPHSFGIRFSGLLMRTPAWLDAILVEPAVQRRWVRFADGSSKVLFNNTSEQAIKVRIEELEEDIDKQRNLNVSTREGRIVEANVKTDRRKRVWMEMPAKAIGKLEL